VIYDGLLLGVRGFVLLLGARGFVLAKDVVEIVEGLFKDGPRTIKIDNLAIKDA
jgi:hypothetical protein